MLTTEFVLEAAKEALTIGIPEITNGDQGVQFTSQEYLSLWDPEKTKISLTGYFDTYNHRRLHQALNYRTPADVYFERRNGS